VLRKIARYVFLGLALLLIYLGAALLAMRYAIQGREVRVPNLVGQTPADAERGANSNGLLLSVESRFYSPDMARGRIVSQAPAAGATVRRGWKIRVAESLGAQRAAIPNLVGQSEHAAEINISRRGLETGTVATFHLAGAQPQVVVAQNPPADAKDASSPKISLLFSAADNAQQYVMPSFIGKSLQQATDVLEEAGFSVGKVHALNAPTANTGGGGATASGTIVHQTPGPGHKVSAGATIDFDVLK